MTIIGESIVTTNQIMIKHTNKIFLLPKGVAYLPKPKIISLQRDIPKPKMKVITRHVIPKLEMKVITHHLNMKKIMIKK